MDQYGNSSAIMNFEIAAQGMGAKYVLDGTDTCAARFNPRATPATSRYNLRELAEAGEAYPGTDAPFDEPELLAIDGDRDLRLDNWTLLEPFAAGDLYLSVM